MHEIIFSVRTWCKSTRHTHKREKPLAEVTSFDQQGLKFQANEKDKATNRSENKEQSTSSALKQTAQSCFIKQETIKTEIMWKKDPLTKHSR